MEEQQMDEASYWFVFHDGELLLQKQPDGALTVPYGKGAPVDLPAGCVVRTVYFPDGETGRAVYAETQADADGRHVMMGLRASYDVLPLELYRKAGKSAEILHWDRNTQYCSLCGAPMKLHTPISKCCTRCGKEVWPQLATAIIVLVRRNDEILLVHPHSLRGNYYGLVAGFVETGETLEECVAREIMEETGIRVENIRYFGSQPWPYPCGLMVGFYADYSGGELVLQDSEIAYGGWFGRDNLPEIPGKLSMARMLIDAWLENRLQQGRA